LADAANPVLSGEVPVLEQVLFGRIEEEIPLPVRPRGEPWRQRGCERIRGWQIKVAAFHERWHIEAGRRLCHAGRDDFTGGQPPASASVCRQGEQLTSPFLIQQQSLRRCPA